MAFCVGKSRFALLALAGNGDRPAEQQKETEVRFLHSALALALGIVGCSSPLFAFSAIGFRAALENCLNSNLSSPDRIGACNEVIYANVLSSRTRARVIASRGNAYFASTNLGNALDDYNRAIELDPELQAALVNRGVTLLRLGKCEQAMSDFSTVHSHDAHSWQALYGRGVCKAKAGDQAGAQSDQAAAAAINPNAAQEFGPVAIARWFQ
jgi:Flp pilus assembly protein TadD